jgi:cell division protein ZapA
VAVLACLNIASRYVKLTQEFEGYKRDSEERIVRLNEEIRARLLSE